MNAVFSIGKTTKSLYLGLTDHRSDKLIDTKILIIDTQTFFLLGVGHYQTDEVFDPDDEGYEYTVKYNGTPLFFTHCSETAIKFVERLAHWLTRSGNAKIRIEKLMAADYYSNANDPAKQLTEGQ